MKKTKKVIKIEDLKVYQPNKTKLEMYGCIRSRKQQKSSHKYFITHYGILDFLAM